MNALRCFLASRSGITASLALCRLNDVRLAIVFILVRFTINGGPEIEQWKEASWAAPRTPCAAGCHDREIVGWEFALRGRAQEVERALEMACFGTLSASPYTGSPSLLMMPGAAAPRTMGYNDVF